jgi:phage-related protein
MSKIEYIKDSGDGQTQWLIEVNGNHIGEITQEREDYASASSRARGTKVVGYAVTFDNGETKWFNANGNARAAFKAAKEYAAQVGVNVTANAI